jgi:hypothetical protein
VSADVALLGGRVRQEGGACVCRVDEAALQGGGDHWGKRYTMEEEAKNWLSQYDSATE